jgi:small multidrug resistance pump
MAWFWLTFTVTSDVVATTALAYTGGKFQLVPALIAVIGYILSFIGLWQAMRRIDVAVVYALWSAVGTAVIAVIGAVLFGQTMTPARVGWLVVILVGVAGLQLSGSHTEAIARFPLDPLTLIRDKTAHPTVDWDYAFEAERSAPVSVVRPRPVLHWDAQHWDAQPLDTDDGDRMGVVVE